MAIKNNMILPNYENHCDPFFGRVDFCTNHSIRNEITCPLYEKECTVNCYETTVSIASSKPMNFILLGVGSLIGLGIFIKFNRLGKFETFSFKCEHCGRSTRGLKCVICKARKPTQI